MANLEFKSDLKLGNEGYDLWLNNSRGNRYSRDHQEFKVNECSKE